MAAKRPTHARPSVTAQREASRRNASRRTSDPSPGTRRTTANGAGGPRTSDGRSGRGGGHNARTRGIGSVSVGGGRGDGPGLVGPGNNPGIGSPNGRGSVHAGNGSPRSASGNGGVLLTRRHFLYGALGVGALAALGGGAAVVVKNMNSDDKELSVLEVPTDAVTTTDAFEMIEDPSTVMGLVGSFELPYGTLVWASGDDVAACLVPTTSAKPLAQVALLSLASGSWPTVIEKAVGQDEGFEIYDVRACASGVVWTEADILDGVWRVYSATTDGSSIGKPALLEEGTSEWETPTLAAADGYAFWQVLPRADGAAKAESSLLKRAEFGSNEASVVYASHGRMCSPPYPLADSVVITPRTDTGAIHHQLTRIDARSGEVLDAMVLPQSMKPLEAGYGSTGFMFSFDAWYSYGDGIANIGTYAPTSPVAAAALDGSGNAAYSDAPWFQFSRTPTAAPAWCGSWLMVKSTSAVCGIDMAGGRYFALDVKSGAEDYGDYLASTGTNDTVVTYSNIDFKPIDGTAQKHCLVRVWAPLG